MNIEKMKNEPSEIMLKNESERRTFDPDKRIDVSENARSIKDKGDKFDPDKRMEISNIHNESSDSRGIEQPRLKAVSDTKENNSNDSTDNNNNSDANDKRIPCRNEELAGKKHPVTGVPFEKRTIIVDDEEKEVVVPVFDSVFDAHLPEDKIKATDREQIKECNKQLKEAVDKAPELRAKFTDEQLEQIANEDTPDGYTWHHDAETGKMQLVDSETHAKTGHTGGQNFWGGGSDNR